MLNALAMATSLELPVVANHSSDPVGSSGPPGKGKITVSLSTEPNKGPEKGPCTAVSAQPEVLGAPALAAPGKGDILRGTHHSGLPD